MWRILPAREGYFYPCSLHETWNIACRAGAPPPPRCTWSAMLKRDATCGVFHVTGRAGGVLVIHNPTPTVPASECWNIQCNMGYVMHQGGAGWPPLPCTCSVLVLKRQCSRGMSCHCKGRSGWVIGILHIRKIPLWGGASSFCQWVRSLALDSSRKQPHSYNIRGGGGGGRATYP